MRRIVGEQARIVLWTAALSVGVAGCVTGSDDGRSAGERPEPGVTKMIDAMSAAFPGSKTDAIPGGVARIYGASLSAGATHAEAAERFRQIFSAAVGAAPNDLVPEDPQQATAPAGAARAAVTSAGTADQGIGLMYDARTGQPKFWLHRYAQTTGGVPVFRGGLLTLVRNDAGNAVVWASSFVKDMTAFRPTAGMRPRSPDGARTLAAIRGTTDFAGRALGAPTALARLSTPDVVVFAGTEDRSVAPRMAIQYTAEAASGGKWRLIADAATGEVLHIESLIVFDNVTGNVVGNATTGDVAMECADEESTAFPFAEVDGPSPELAFTDVNGAYTLVNSVPGPLNVTSLMGGQFFDVVNLAGGLETLTSSVTPPAMDSFVHNSADTDPQVLAQVNGYVNANQIRAFLLKYLPTYPVISSQTNFPVNVNLSSANSGTCPGNAFYDGASINFCLGSSTYTNTSFASVSHHEYGHHIINSGGSGQGEYGEGMADTVAVLQSGQHGLAYGFFLNQCATPLRDADNTCQFSTGCSSCGSEIHACGQLISGTIWSVRKALAVSNPSTYVDLINNLVLSSIPLHKGTAINSQIAIDLLTLDDNDGNLNNGTPHYNDICSGFTAHGMTCPAILTGLSITPAGNLSSEGQVGGPFAPASVAYTLSNLGPNATLSYQVAPSAPAPWLAISNGSGQIALGQTVQVTVAIDQTAAAALVKGGYDAVVQFTNLTDGVGNATRAAHLEVGVPPAIFSETFEGGLGGFQVAASAANLWHVSSSCASSQPGHSTPNSLYFGVDSSCTFSTGAAVAGAATSLAVQITDTSVAKLRFNYFLTTEHVSPFDNASVQISVNNGPFTIAASNNQGGVALQEGATWAQAEVDLTPLLAGLTSPVVRIRVAFDSVDSVLNSFTGFLVDDVQLLAFSGTVINSAPTVNAGPDQAITLPASASLSGTVSDDGLPNPPAAFTTAWTMVSGPGTVTFGNAGAAVTTATFSTAGSYVLRLTANDSALSATDDVVITVSPVPVNQPPVVNAGFDQTITLPASATLNGTVTDDGLPNPPATVTTLWSVVSGPGTVTFGNASAKATTATFSASGSYTLRLTASDSLLSASDDVVVSVNPPPNLGIGLTPTGGLSAEGPAGGPFAPASLVYTLTNLGSNATVAYQVAPSTPTSWLTITNGTGQLALGQTAQITVTINPTAAATLANGGYDAVLQFTNLTDGVGNTTRPAHLQVGVPVPIFSETFEGGLGSFSLGTEAQNLWHVSAGCASLQPGHSTPDALYFGIDSTCNYSNGLAVAGTATSVPIAIANTSVVKLRFNYFLATENISSFDRASIQVSVNSGAFTIVASNNQGGVALPETTAWTAGEVDLAPLVAGLSSPSVRLRVAFDSNRFHRQLDYRIRRRRHQGARSGGGLDEHGTRRERGSRPGGHAAGGGEPERHGDRRWVAGAAGDVHDGVERGERAGDGDVWKFVGGAHHGDVLGGGQLRIAADRERQRAVRQRRPGRDRERRAAGEQAASGERGTRPDDHAAGGREPERHRDRRRFAGAAGDVHDGVERGERTGDGDVRKFVGGAHHGDVLGGGQLRAAIDRQRQRAPGHRRRRRDRERRAAGESTTGGERGTRPDDHAASDGEPERNGDGRWQAEPARRGHDHLVEGERTGDGDVRQRERQGDHGDVLRVGELHAPAHRQRQRAQRQRRRRGHGQRRGCQSGAGGERGTRPDDHAASDGEPERNSDGRWQAEPARRGHDHLVEGERAGDGDVRQRERQGDHGDVLRVGELHAPAHRQRQRAQRQRRRRGHGQRRGCQSGAGGERGTRPDDHAAGDGEPERNGDGRRQAEPARRGHDHLVEGERAGDGDVRQRERQGDHGDVLRVGELHAPAHRQRQRAQRQRRRRDHGQRRRELALCRHLHEPDQLHRRQQLPVGESGDRRRLLPDDIGRPRGELRELRQPARADDQWNDRGVQQRQLGVNTGCEERRVLLPDLRGQPVVRLLHSLLTAGVRSRPQTTGSQR